MNARKELMEGQVAQIVSERELAITLGARDGVKKGMRFAVLASPVEVRHPQTGELLGVVNRIKVRVQVVSVQEKMSICSTYRTRVVGGTALESLLTNIYGQRRVIPETLRADDESYLPPLSPEESYVKIGDPVKELEELPQEVNSD